MRWLGARAAETSERAADGIEGEGGGDGMEMGWDGMGWMEMGCCRAKVALEGPQALWRRRLGRLGGLTGVSSLADPLAAYGSMGRC